MVEIIRASNNEIDVIESLYIQKVKELANKNLKQWDMEEIMWKELSKDYKADDFYLVYYNQKAVGAFVIVNYDPTYWLKDKKDDALYIHKVMVLDEVEKQGISDQILTYFKSKGKELGYPSVKLDVREYKDKLRSFYERNGFTLKEIVDLNKGYFTCLYEYKFVE